MFNMFKKQGTSKRSASTSMIGDREPGFGKASPTGEQAETGEQAIAGDMAWAGACEELSDAQLATCGGGVTVAVQENGPGGDLTIDWKVFDGLTDSEAAAYLAARLQFTDITVAADNFKGPIVYGGPKLYALYGVG